MHLAHTTIILFIAEDSSYHHYCLESVYCPLCFRCHATKHKYVNLLKGLLYNRFLNLGVFIL